jgi:hypothetical protein
MIGGDDGVSGTTTEFNTTTVKTVTPVKQRRPPPQNDTVIPADAGIHADCPK